MNYRKKLIIAGILVAVAIAIRLLSLRPQWIEKHYSNGCYPAISRMLKYAFGWLPFSLGDILYGFFAVWIMVKLAGGFKLLIRRQYNRQQILQAVLFFTNTALTIYIVFNLLWGLNYNRLGIMQQLDIRKEKYTAAELIHIDSLLISKVNESKLALLRTKRQYPERKQIFGLAAASYNRLSANHRWMTYYPVSAKTSLWGWAGNYLGFTGYYNPFTGEAQLNTGVPKFMQPYTACHELAHQLGYAKENEANFVGYLAASASPDTLFHYSVYLDLYLYTQRNLYLLDSVKAKKISQQLIPEVKTDLRELKDFYAAHQSVLEPVFKWIYGFYLRQNEQPSGILSYDEVTGFIIAYFRKYGRI